MSALPQLFLSCLDREPDEALVTFVQQSAKRLFFAQSRRAMVQFALELKIHRIPVDLRGHFSKKRQSRLGLALNLRKIGPSSRLRPLSGLSISSFA
jgi:hypothetical protein